MHCELVATMVPAQQMLSELIQWGWLSPDCDAGEVFFVNGCLTVARIREYLARMVFAVVRNTSSTERYASSLMRAIQLLIDRLDDYDNALVHSTEDTIEGILHTIACNCAVTAETWNNLWAALPSTTEPRTAIPQEVGAEVTRLLLRCSFNMFIAYAQLRVSS